MYLYQPNYFGISWLLRLQFSQLNRETTAKMNPNEQPSSSSITKICEQFENEWQAGKPPAITDYLKLDSFKQRIELLEELIKLDFSYRLKNEMSPNPAIYTMLGDDAVRIAEQVQRSHSGDDSDATDAYSVTHAPSSIIRDPTSTQSQPAPTRPEQTLANSKQIGPYKLLQKIGEGGMGSVWMAEQEEPVRRRVALKFIKAEMASKEIIARFEAERQALAMMDHQNIAKVLDAGSTEAGMPFFVMELVKGIPITKFCDENKLSIDERLELFVPVCKAIQHAHQKGILHRDLKPSNVLVTLYDGEPVSKVIDFGLAKATEHTLKLTDKTMFTEFGKIVGTLQYMSPEQAETNALDVDTRTDIYSLGVMLYELLTGSTPLNKKTLSQTALLQVLAMIKESEHPRPSNRLSSSGNAINGISDQRKITPAKLQLVLRGELDWIVMKALEKDRSRRYETASGFADDIQRFLNDEAVLARPQSTGYRIRKFIRKNKGLVASTAAIALLLLAAVGGTSWFAVESSREAERANREAKRANLEAKRAVEAEKLAAENAKQSQQDKVAATKSAKRSKEALKIFTDSFLSIDPSSGANADMSAKDVLFRAQQSLQDSRLDDEGQAELLNSLTTTFYGVGEYKAAVSTAEDVVKINRTLHGVDHPKTLTSMAGLASSYQASGQTNKALELEEQILEKRKNKLGLDHPDTLTSMSDLAISYSRIGMTTRAIELNQNVLKQRRNMLGPNDPATVISMNNLATNYSDSGQTNEALELHKEAFELLNTLNGSEHPATLSSMANLAFTYRLAGQVTKALELDKEVLELQTTKLGPDHPDTLISMNNLAISYSDAGQFAAALKLNKEVLELRKLKLGPNHPDTITSLNNLAVNFSDSGQTNQALKLNKEALELMKTAHGSEHPLTLQSMANLAVTHRYAGQIADALELDKKVLELRKRKLGPNHPDTLSSMNNLVSSFSAAGQFAEALELSKDVLERRKTKLGPDHPDTLASMNDLASSYSDAGQITLALKLNKEVVERMAEVSGSDHPNTLSSMALMATHHRLAGQVADALELDKKVLELRKQKLGTNHPDTLTSMNNLALSHRAAGQNTEALELNEKVLEILLSNQGPDHPQTLNSKSNLALSYYDAGQIEKSRKLNEKVLARRRATLGPNHPDTLTSMSNLAISYDAAGQISEAIKLNKKALEIRKTHLGVNHPDTIMSMSNLALNYSNNGQTEHAIELDKEVLELRKKSLGVEHPDTMTSLNNLAANLWQAKKLDESAPLFEQVLELQSKKLGRAHPSTQLSVANLGVNYRDSGRLDEAIPLLEEAFESSKKYPLLNWVEDSLRDAYFTGQKAAKLEKLLETIISKARKGSDPIALRKEIGISGLELLQLSSYAKAEEWLQEYYDLLLPEDSEAWNRANAQVMLGAAIFRQARMDEARPMLIAGYEKLKQHAKDIPEAARKTLLLRSANTLIAFAEETKSEEELKKWTAEKEWIESKYGAENEKSVDANSNKQPD